MVRGWQVELYDGTILTEDSTKWKDVPKVKINKLSLLFDGRRWDLTDRQAYFIKNKASMVPGVKESFQIEQRCIGYYEGAQKVHYIVDEFTGKFHMEVEDND
jgi:hypothetical protein